MTGANTKTNLDVRANIRVLVAIVAIPFTLFFGLGVTEELAHGGVDLWSVLGVIALFLAWYLVFTGKNLLLRLFH